MNKVVEKNKNIIIAILYFLSYGMVMNTLVMNHDSIRRMGGQALENRFAVGRFMIDPYYAIVHQNQINPVISVTILVICYFLAVKLIIKLFDIKSAITQVLVHGLVISYPITTFFFAYGQDSDAYAVAFLLSVVSVYLLKAESKKRNLLAIVTVAISLGFYQAYITFTLAFLLLTYFFKGKSDLDTVKDIILKLFYVGLGCILYFIIFKLTVFITGTELASYNNVDSLSVIDIFLQMPSNIAYSFKEFADIVMKNSFLFNTQYSFIIINILILVTYIVYIIKSDHKMLKIILGILFIPAMYSAQIITGEFPQYIEFGYLIYLVGSVIIITDFVQNTRLSKIRYIEYAFVIPVIVVLSQIALTNQIHTKTILLTQSSLDLAEKVYFDLAAEPNYEAGDEVYAVGDLFKNENIAQNTTYKPYNVGNFSNDTSWLPGFRGTTSGTSRDWPSLVRILGYDVNAISTAEYTGDREKIDESPEFPKEGYIYEDENGVFVINMGSDYKS